MIDKMIEEMKSFKNDMLKAREGYEYPDYCTDKKSENKCNEDCPECMFNNFIEIAEKMKK